MKPPNACGIYAIIHLESGRRYIGSSKNMRVRRNGHFSKLRRNKHTCPHLQHAWNKYGEKAFDFEVLELCLNTPETKVVRERHWMLRFKNCLYNSSTEPLPRTNEPMLPHVREKLMAATYGNKHREGKHYSGRLTEDDVKEIFRRYAEGEPTESLTQAYQCWKNTIWNILKRESWWSVEIPDDVLAKCNERRKQKARGEKHGRSKLTIAMASEIKRRLVSGESQSQIAREIGVHSSTVWSIACGRTFGYVAWPDHPVALNASNDSGPLPQSQTDPSAA